MKTFCRADINVTPSLSNRAFGSSEALKCTIFKKGFVFVLRRQERYILKTHFNLPSQIIYMSLCKT